MAFDPQGINPDEQVTPDQAVVQEGPGANVQAAAQLPDPGQLQQPQVQAPDMSQLMAQQDAYKKSLLPQTGASSPTTLSPDQYTQTQLQNLEARKGITTQQADISSAQAQRDAQINQDAAKDQARMLAEDQIAKQKAMDDATARDTDIMQRINKASQEHVDPNHWWNSKSSAGKFQATIGMFLSGLGDPQLAMQQLHHTIDSDINAQQSNIANHWQAIKDIHSVNDSAFNRDVHDQEWRNQYRIGAMEVTKQQLASSAAMSKDGMVKTNAQNAIMDISKQQDDYRYQNWQLRQKMLAAQGSGKAALQKRLDEQHKEYAAHFATMTDPNTGGRSEAQAHQELNKLYPELVQYGMVPMASSSGMNTQAPVSQNDKAAARTEQKDLETRTVELPNGQLGLATDAAARKDYTERVSGTKNWMQKFERVKQLQKNFQDGTLTNKEVGEWEALNADLTNTMNSTFAVTRQAGVGEGERIAKELLPEPPGWWGTNVYNTNAQRDYNDGRVKAIEAFMPERVKQAMGDITPLQDKKLGQVSIQEAPGAAVEQLKEKFGFKPTVKPSGGIPQQIPNILNNSGPSSPGIPSFSQYNQGR